MLLLPLHLRPLRETQRLGMHLLLHRQRIAGLWRAARFDSIQPHSGGVEDGHCVVAVLGSDGVWDVGCYYVGYCCSDVRVME